MAIPNATISHHHTGTNKAEFAAGIRTEDFPHIADLLINLYSNPVEAVMREYATNALDAHIAVGNTAPILITLPTQYNPNFVVQDFGIGLTIDDLRDVYSMYGRSLKRDSNAYVGQLGLGCKSGLTYADAFTIEATKDGVKCVATSTKDERGVGTIKVKDTVGTTDPNGVRITIPVKARDIDNFRNTAQRLFQFWEPGTVLINGEAPEVPEWRNQGLAIDDDTWVIPSDIGLYSSYIVMGNVAYEVADAEVGVGHNRRLRRFVARVNIGDVDFVPSREALKYTDWTHETIRDLHAYVNLHFSRVLNARLAQCATRWEETQLKVLWKGSSMRISASQAVPIWEYTPSSWGRQARAHTGYTYESLTRSSTVVITNFPNKSLSPLHRERLRELAPTCKKFIVVPQGCDISGLAGRGEVYTWTDVVGATEDPSPRATVKRDKRPETRYSTLDSAIGFTAKELSAKEANGEKILFLWPKDYADGGSLGCTVVSLYSSNQIDRLRRFVPSITHYDVEYKAQRDAAEAAVTDYDRRLVGARSLNKVFSRLPVAQITDPDLAEAIRMATASNTPTLAAASRLNITVEAAGGNLTKRFAKRYPLLDPDQHYYRTNTPDEDAILYINSKYAGIAAKAASKALDYKFTDEALDSEAS